MILVTRWFGSFLCVEGEVKRAALFPQDASEIATRLARMQRGDILEEEANLAGSAKQVADRRLTEFGKFVKFDSSFIRPQDYGFTLELYRRATMELAKQAVKSSIGPDVHLGHAVRAYDDLLLVSNMVSERLHEWYGVHFPEFSEVVAADQYAKAISEHGSRESVLTALDLDMDSIGSDIDPQDLVSVRTLADTLERINIARMGLGRYIEERMKEVAPNVGTIAGPMLGARLIMKAGSLRRLASLPAGTIQLLGAEKAMFKHLREGSRPPKHGVLFQHPMVHSAPYWQRGAIARALAAKLCLAARADAYTRNDISPLLKSQIEKTLGEIKKKHPNPPKKTSRRKKPRHH